MGQLVVKTSSVPMLEGESLLGRACPHFGGGVPKLEKDPYSKRAVPLLEGSLLRRECPHFGGDIPKLEKIPTQKGAVPVLEGESLLEGSVPSLEEHP